VITGTTSDAELAAALRPLVFQLYYVTRRHAPPHTLTITQSSVLRHLMAAGPMRMGELADAEGVQLPSMTNVITRMARMGLVRREPDPDDKRAMRVHVTDDGARFYTEITAIREEFLRHRLSEMDERDRRAIADALPALSRLIGAEGSNWSR
jgi:DNA-binding MarR family transcriptional regulator